MNDGISYGLAHSQVSQPRLSIAGPNAGHSRRRKMKRCWLMVGLALLSAPAFAQGYPPQMTMDGRMVPGFSVNPMNTPFWNNQNVVGDVIRGTHDFRDPRTGYNYSGDNNMRQWIGPGNQRAQTWYDVPPPGYGWRPLMR
jgi:hypothetical protein